MKRDLAEASVIDFISRELLSDEAIRVAKVAYQEEIKEHLAQLQLGEDHGMAELPAQEQRLRDMMKAGILAPDVAQPALEAIH